MELDTKIFVRAAERIANQVTRLDYCCCYAIDNVYVEQGNDEGEYELTPEVRYLEGLLKPKYGKGWWYLDKRYTDKNNQLARQLGLLLCAEVYKDENKGK